MFCAESCVALDQFPARRVSRFEGIPVLLYMTNIGPILIELWSLFTYAVDAA
jgi:hypothetical protein